MLLTDQVSAHTDTDSGVVDPLTQSIFNNWVTIRILTLMIFWKISGRSLGQWQKLTKYAFGFFWHRHHPIWWCGDNMRRKRHRVHRYSIGGNWKTVVYYRKMTIW